MHEFSRRQIAGALLYAVFHMILLWLKGLSWPERFVFGALIGLPIMYLLLYLTGG